MVLPPLSEKKFTEDFPPQKIVVTGAGGFIASHLARRLKAEGHYVRAVDWKENEYMKEEEFCNEFRNLDLRSLEACREACEGMDWCFNLAVRSCTSSPRRVALRHHAAAARPPPVRALACVVGGHGRHGLHPVEPLPHPVQLDDDQLQHG